MHMPSTVDVLGLNYAVTNYREATALILNAARNHQSFSVFALPVHGVIERQNDADFAQACESADLIVPDGQPIRWMMNWLHDANLHDRVYGPELLRHILAAPHADEFRVFVYGGRTEAVQEAFVTLLERTYQNVKVCGRYREPDILKQTLSAEMVNQSKPHLVIVGLGCPKQEKWIAKQKGQVNAALVGVGAAFSFFTGDQKVAPKWMQDRGLEWLFRLMSEPKRLWRRYLYTNTVFILLAAKALYKSSRNRR